MTDKLGLQALADQAEIAIHRADNRQRLRGLDLPVTILYGREDQICPPEQRQECRKAFKNSQVFEIENAGHFVLLEQPEIMVAHFRKWLEGLEETSDKKIEEHMMTEKSEQSPPTTQQSDGVLPDGVLQVERHDYQDLAPTDRQRSQSMEGFDPIYTDIVDYIVRCTHKIWDERDVGLIYSHYTHNIVLYSSMGTIYNREDVVRDTIQRLASFPERRGLASSVIWNGDDNRGFYTSHLVTGSGRHSQHGHLGAPTGRAFTTRTVADCALLLEVLAGDDGIDGRQRGDPACQNPAYTDALGQGVQGLRVGVVKEGFDRPESEAGVDACVRAALKQLRAQGAVVETVSIPWHHTGSHMYAAIGMGGVAHAWAYGHGIGYGVNGAYPQSFMKAFDAWKTDPDALAPTVKATLLIGEVMYRQGGQLYAKVRNLTRRLRAEYDARLAEYDVLVMPTTPMAATPLTTREAPLEEVMRRSWETLGNACPFDLTGHPAISVCCGQTRRPVGLMIVGRHWQDRTVLQVADAVHMQW